MRANSEAAARYSTTYCGQLARARLGHGIASAAPTCERRQRRGRPCRRDFLRPWRTRPGPVLLDGLCRLSDDAATLAAVADLATRNDDARAVLLVGKGALERGLPWTLRFPDIGVPHYSPIGPALDRSVVYSVARTESEFDQRDVSPAKAVGTMQVTPEAGRDTAKASF